MKYKPFLFIQFFIIWQQLELYVSQHNSPAFGYGHFLILRGAST